MRTRALLGTGLVNCADKFGELGGVIGRPLSSGVLDGSSADVAGVTGRPLSDDDDELRQASVLTKEQAPRSQPA